MHCNGVAVQFSFPFRFYARPWCSSELSGWTWNWGPLGWLVVRVGSCFDSVDFDGCPGHNGHIKTQTQQTTCEFRSCIRGGGTTSQRDT